jgi:hypothetical protein
MEHSSTIEEKLHAYLSDEPTLIMPTRTLMAKLAECQAPEPRPTVPATPWAIRRPQPASGMRPRINDDWYLKVVRTG